MSTPRTGGSAYGRLLDALESDGRKVKRQGDRSQAQCPAHEDSAPSLSVTGIEGQVLVHCHAGCDVEDVLTALGLTKADLFDGQSGARYEYTDALGTILRTVTRTPEKRFKQRIDDKSVVPLYRLPQLLKAVEAGRTIYLVEGEKDVHAAEAIGLVATTAPQGASNFDKADVSPLAGAHVVAVVDKDSAGKKWAAAVAEKLDGCVRHVEFRQADQGKDLADHVAAGGTVETLIPLALDEEGDRLPRLWKATSLRSTGRIEWLASRRLPRSAVSILVGEEGIGKSLLWVWIVAAVTTGRAAPGFGIPAREPADVLVVITEDGWADTVRPRLEVAGADLNRITILCSEEDGSGAPMFPRDFPVLLSATPRPALIIIDAFLDTVSPGLTMKDPQQARQALHPWKEVATLTGAAVVLMTHTNRVASASPRDKYGITGELRKKARMALYAQRDDEGHLTVGPEKSNLVGRVNASVFGITPVPVFPATEDDDGTVPRLDHLGDAAATAGELVAEKYEDERDGDRDDRSEAEAWLEDYIAQAGGTVPSKDAKGAAKKAGISERTMKRAAKSLGVTIEQHGFPRVTFWTLGPSRASEATDDPHVSESGPTGADQHKRSGPTAQLGQWGHAERHGPTAAPLHDEPTLFAVETGHRCETCGTDITETRAIAFSTCISCTKEKSA